MKRSKYPAVFPVLALAAGIEASFHCPFLPLPLAVTLALLGVALRRRWGWWMAWFGLGMAAGVLAGGVTYRTLTVELPTGIDAGKPVTAVLEIAEPWRRGEFGWSAWARVRTLRQGNHVVDRPRRLLLQLSGDEAPPPTGSRVRAKGALGRRQAYLNEPRVPPGPWRFGVKSRSLLTVEAQPGPLAILSNALRGRLEAALAIAPQTPARGLARALVLGDAGDVPVRWSRTLRRFGASHLLAVSGLHVGLVAGAALVLGAWLPVPVQRCLVILAAVAYILAVGPRPSVLRAAAMAGLAVAALSLRRPPTTTNALAVFCGGSLLLEPSLLRSQGFLLSVAATGGLVAWSPQLARRWSRVPRFLAQPLAASCSAQLASSPLAIPWFHLWIPAAPVFNLLLVPWAALFLGISLLWVLVALLVPSWAVASWPVVESLARPLDILAEFKPHPWVAWPLVVTVPMAALASVLLALMLWWPRWAAYCLAALGLTVVLVWTLQPFASGDQGRPAPELVMLDVGQGDAFVLRDGGRALLVDGGGWSRGDFGGRALLPALAGLGIRHIDAVVLTHPDRDHCGGLEDIVDYLPVDALWTFEAWLEAPCGEALQDRGLSILRLEAGSRAQLESWRLRVLHPVAAQLSDANAGSLVLQAEAEGWKVLLTGDIDHKTERSLTRSLGSSLASDILKVSHHGSGGSSDSLFLRTVAPRLALVSAGRNNRYGHPHPKALERLERIGARVLRTDTQGQVRLQLHEGRLHLATGGE